MSRRNELFELTRVRVLLFLREPEAIFWVFVFPLVLAGVLGFAFRSKGVAPARVGLVEGAGAEALAAALARDEHVEVVRFATAEEARRKLARDGAREAEVELERVEETGSRYVDFLFPGLIGMNLMGTGMWGIGFAIADVRRRKFLKRLLVTPMRRSSFFLSFLLARGVFLAMELLALGLFGRWILGVPLRGGVLAFGLVSLLGAFAFAGIGILTASRARTMEAVSGLMNLVMMPMWLGSGVFFSIERFPAAAQPLLRLLPLTALNDALRGVCLDGAGLSELGAPLGLLVAWGVVSFAVALRIFRWE